MIVFSDMDGTLLTSDKQMGDATWAMLDELARRSIEFVPCTGRPLSGVFEPILAHPAVHYAVCANGASVWQLDDDVPNDASRATRILSRPLDRGIAHRVHRIAAGHDVTFDIFADGQCFLPARSTRAWTNSVAATPHRGFAQAHTNADRHGYRQQNRRGRDARTHRHVLARPRRSRRHRGALDTLGGIEVTRSYAMNIEVMGEGTTKERPSRGCVSIWASVSPTPGRSATTSTTSPCCRQRAMAWP